MIPITTGSKGGTVLALTVLFALTAPPALADTFADCWQTADPDLELAACTKLIDGGGLDPTTLAKAHTGRGVALAKLGRFEEAIAQHSRALELVPGFALAHANRGSAFSLKGEHARAIEDFTAAIGFDARRLRAWNGRAWALFKLGRLEEALADVEQALTLKPTDPASLDTKGHVLEALGRKEEAIAAYRAALAGAPGLAESLAGLARLGATP